MIQAFFANIPLIPDSPQQISLVKHPISISVNGLEVRRAVQQCPFQ